MHSTVGRVDGRFGPSIVGSHLEMRDRPGQCGPLVPPFATVLPGCITLHALDIGDLTFPHRVVLRPGEWCRIGVRV